MRFFTRRAFIVVGALIVVLVAWASALESLESPEALESSKSSEASKASKASESSKALEASGALEIIALGSFSNRAAVRAQACLSELELPVLARRAPARRMLFSAEQCRDCHASRVDFTSESFSLNSLPTRLRASASRASASPASEPHANALFWLTEPGLIVKTALPPYSAESRALLAAGRLSFVPARSGEQFFRRSVDGSRVNLALRARTLESSESLVLVSPQFDRVATETSLREPALAPFALESSPFLMTSLRLAPPMAIAGLIERIPEHNVLEGVEKAPNKGATNKGRGRVQRVYDESCACFRVGKFGWKAGFARLSGAIRQALTVDMGLRATSSLDLDYLEAELASLESAFLAHAETYLNSAAPKEAEQRARSYEARIFDSTGCASCHAPAHRLDSGERVFFYSDFLLHFMGKELADGFVEGRANGYEWKTAPLLGARPPYLHDGRAATIEEAVGFHGGEAARARAHYFALDDEQRRALDAFIRAQAQEC